MRLNYILDADGETPIAVDVFAWGAWFEDWRHRRVMQTDIGWPTYSYQYAVSTVFLGLDHNFGGSGDPVLWETMIFCWQPKTSFRITPRNFRLRPKLHKHVRPWRDRFGFDQQQERYTSLAAAARGHQLAEVRVYSRLYDLRPLNVPPKLHHAYISPAALRVLTTSRVQ